MSTDTPCTPPPAPPVRCSFCLCCLGQGEPKRKRIIVAHDKPGVGICDICAKRSQKIVDTTGRHLRLVVFTPEPTPRSPDLGGDEYA